MADGIVVVDNAVESRFEVLVDGKVAGFAQYRLRPTSIVFTHTEVLPGYQGKGLAATLIGQALDMSRDTGLEVVPSCPYVAKYIAEHPEYADLVVKKQH